MRHILLLYHFNMHCTHYLIRSVPLRVSSSILCNQRVLSFMCQRNDHFRCLPHHITIETPTYSINRIFSHKVEVTFILSPRNHTLRYGFERGCVYLHAHSLIPVSALSRLSAALRDFVVHIPTFRHTSGTTLPGSRSPLLSANFAPFRRHSKTTSSGLLHRRVTLHDGVLQVLPDDSMT